MNNNRKLLLAASLCVSTLAAAAEEPKNSELPKPPSTQTAPGTPLSDCTAYLKPDYVESIKPANFLDGNKLVGSFRGFEADFAKFSRKESKEIILIPKSAILYMTGKPQYIRF